MDGGQPCDHKNSCRRGPHFAGPCGFCEPPSNSKRLRGRRVGAVHYVFLVILNESKRVGGMEERSDATTTRYSTSMVYSCGYSVSERTHTVGFCMACLVKRADGGPLFRGVAALSPGLTLRRPRRNGVRCRGWGKPPIMRSRVPSKHGSP